MDISKGDRVNVFFDRCEAEYNVQVIDFPAGYGDSWRFMRMDGTPVYVQTFAKIVRTLAIGQAEKVMEPLGNTTAAPAKEE